MFIFLTNESLFLGTERIICWIYFKLGNWNKFVHSIWLLKKGHLFINFHFLLKCYCIWELWENIVKWVSATSRLFLSFSQNWNMFLNFICEINVIKKFVTYFVNCNFSKYINLFHILMAFKEQRLITWKLPHKIQNIITRTSTIVQPVHSPQLLCVYLTLFLYNFSLPFSRFSRINHTFIVYFVGIRSTKGLEVSKKIKKLAARIFQTPEFLHYLYSCWKDLLRLC